MTRRVTLALALAGALACKPEAPPADINSGDTVQLVRATTRAHELIVKKGKDQATVRLVGIYTFSTWPREKTDVSNHAQEAIDYLAREFAGRPAQLILIRKELDPRGRYLGFMEMNGVDIGKKLIEVGHAAVYTEYPFAREQAYMAAEVEPRANNLGIWSGHTATKRIDALRHTWAAVRHRDHDDPVHDPLVGK